MFYLEKQLDRLTTMNPELRDALDKKPDNFLDAAKPSGSQAADQSQVAQLLASSTLIKSYEQIMNQYEVELEKKSKLIAQMDAEQQGIIQENSDLSQQIYVLRTKFSPDGAQIKDGSRILTADEEKIQTIQRDQMVELLRRNHDVLMEKYELVRRQHEALEKTSAQKEELFNKMQVETEQLRSKVFDLEKATAELANEKELLERGRKALE